MNRIFDLLLAFGYPKVAVDWLRRRRLLVIIVLAGLSWALFIGLGWLAAGLFWRLFAGEG